MNSKTKCAFDAGRKCNALANKRCNGCAFFKTVEEVKKSRTQTEKRIRSLPRCVQLGIFSKYYPKGGKVI